MKSAGNITRTVVVLLLTAVPMLLASAQSPFVTLEGRSFKLNGQEYYPVVLNYYAEIVSNANQSADTLELYYSPASHYDANPYGHFESIDSAVCRAQLETHFAKIVSMGFNTIRLNQTVIMSKDGPGGQRHYKIDVRFNQINTWPPHYRLDLDLNTFTSDLSMRYFHLLRKIIRLANAAGLKTILVCGEDAEGWDDPNQLTLAQDDQAVDLYASYLVRLAEELKDEPGLIAYDLWNEPNWTASHLTAWSKAEICDFTKRWYEAIHGTNEAPRDQNHWITLGGSTFNEVATWDPAVMKLDFYSPHIYPGLLTLDDYDLQSAIEQVKAQLYWLGADCPMPWLIGETGFIADDDWWDPLDASGSQPNHNHLDPDPAYHMMPWMQGSEQDQADYATLSLDAVRNYGGSGYSWWDFQNCRDVSIPGVLNDYPNDPDKWLQGNFFGLLHYGNDVALLPNANLPGAPAEWFQANPWRDKKVVSPGTDIFANYDPGSAPTALPAPPTNYYSWQGTGGALEKQYTLKDQNDLPVANGLATVVWFYHTADPSDLPTTGKDFWDRNVANADGLCSISRRAQPGSHYDDPDPLDLRIQATGAGELLYSPEQGIPWPQNGSIIPIVRKRLFFEDIVSGLVVGVDEEKDVKAWSKLTLEDAAILGTGTDGGEATFHGRDEIHVQSEFHAQFGSEVHIFTEPTFLECGTEVVGMVQQSGDYTRAFVQKDLQQPRRLLLAFNKPELQISAYPNPCTTALYVTFTEGTGTCTAYNVLGEQVLTTSVINGSLQIDTEGWVPGEYTIRIDVSGLEHTAKVTKQ